MLNQPVLLELCRRAAEELKAGTIGEGTQAVVDALDREPALVAQLIDAVAAEGSTKKANDAIIAALAFLIGRGLEFVRYRVDRKAADGLALADQLRAQILALGRDGRLAPATLLLILGQFIQAKLEMGDALRDLMAELAGHAGREAPSRKAAESGRDPWADVVKVAGGDPFALHTELFAHAGVFPESQRAMIAASMLQAEQPSVRESAIGWLLDTASLVRRTIAEALAAMAASGQVSGVMFRRIVSMRNWLPEQDRRPLDDAIRACRQQGIPCAPWPTAKLAGIVVSAFDGSGTQTIFVVVREKRKYAVAALLVNLDAGIRDSWVQSALTRRDLDAFMSEVTEQLDLYPSSVDYVQKSLAHSLAVATEANAIPPFSVLQFAEIAGIGDVNPALTGTEELIASLCRLIEHEPTVPAEADSGEHEEDLETTYPFLDSWFEEDDEVDALLAANPGPIERQAAFVRDTFLIHRRRRWAQMLAWTALALRESQTAQPWAPLALAARDVANGDTLDRIPVMDTVALTTALVYAEKSAADPGDR